MEKKLPRGLRNNNPGNIRITKDKWQGLREEQTDKEFFQFVSADYGYRALLRTLQNYRRRHGCKSIADYIRRWAPSCENNTNAYIISVCSQMNVPSSFMPDIYDRDTMCAFAAAISYHENGREANMDDVRKGWDLL